MGNFVYNDHARTAIAVIRSMFRFPLKHSVHIQCGVQLCSENCLEVHANWNFYSHYCRVKLFLLQFKDSKRSSGGFLNNLILNNIIKVDSPLKLRIKEIWNWLGGLQPAPRRAVWGQARPQRDIDLSAHRFDDRSSERYRQSDYNAVSNRLQIGESTAVHPLRHIRFPVFVGGYCQRYILHLRRILLLSDKRSIR